MNRTLARMTLLAALGVCSSLAMAQTSVGVGVSVQAGARQAESDDRINPADKPATHPYCLRATGSHIPSRARNRGLAGQASRPDCLSVSGRVYTKEDLARTGTVNIADALRRLDPSFY